MKFELDPDFLLSFQLSFQYPALGWALAALAAAALGALVHRLGRPVVLRVSRPFPTLGAMARHCEAPSAWALPLLMLQLVLRSAPDALPAIAALRHAVTVALILALTWLVQRAVRGAAEAVLARYPVAVEDNLLARRVHTQTRVLTRSLMAGVGLLGLAAVLMTFPEVRAVGASLLASAGLAGLVVGMAARPVLSNLIAGVQLALTQPIRLDDVLIVEGEWGWVEEITGTYVVLRLWDLRRLVVPLQWFIEHPFQNWTRSSAEIVGSVFWWVDYRLPVAPLRAELERLCRAAPEWDGKLALLQVTDASERAMQLRALVTARDSPKAWDLRCRVREGLIDFIQREYPQYLPRVRAEMFAAPEAAAAAPPPAGT
jgi:small-conductance mechanosensitive channel